MIHQPPPELDGFRVIPGGVLAPREFVGGAIAAGIKAGGSLDLGAIVSRRTPCTVAGAYTTNRVRGAAVEIDIERGRSGRARAVVFNSGNANTFTGPEGHAEALEMAAGFAARHGLAESEVLLASTGVIGFRLPMSKVRQGIADMELDVSDGIVIAEAMMTTDAGPKSVAVEVPLSGGVVRIGGAAKGAGMLHPNMATMFAFLTTDAALVPEHARRLFSAAVDASFNLISIDADQSTSDTALLLANGAALAEAVPSGSDDAATFAHALQAVCGFLAREMVRGGEGVTKIFSVTVRGALDTASARQAARAVSTSLLVKTAVHGGDPNWGRLVAALGASGVEFDPAAIDVAIGPTTVVSGGRPSAYDEPSVAAHFAGTECSFTIDLHRGEATATAWGCDLSHGYIDINAAYMT